MCSHKKLPYHPVFFEFPLDKKQGVIIIITGDKIMRISTRFTVATHILALIALNDGNPATSEKMALSVGNHPVVVRQIMSSMNKAGLTKTQNGVPGGKLAKAQEDITLYDIYQAVKENSALFDFHPKPNPLCPIGRNIKEAMEMPLLAAQTAMEDILKKYSLKDITKSIVESVNREHELSVLEKGLTD